MLVKFKSIEDILYPKGKSITPNLTLPRDVLPKGLGYRFCTLGFTHTAHSFKRENEQFYCPGLV